MPAARSGTAVGAAPGARAGADGGATSGAAPSRQSADSARAVPTRRIAFDQSFADVPKHFAGGGDLITSHLVMALSSLFPDGEDFFVRSVRHFRDQVTDPALKRQVAGFIGQESVHGREHRGFNTRLAELGYPARRYEQITKRGLALRERLMPPIANLAATAALEHFTATLAELVLTSEEIRQQIGHPAVRDLFVWHALEESEHKAVAFDVYRAVGGSERLRVLTMKMMRILFVVSTVAMVVASLLGDRRTYRRGELRTSLQALGRSPLASAGLWRQLCDYDRRAFHPDDHDTRALVEQWRQELFGEQGTLVDKLVRTAA